MIAFPARCIPICALAVLGAACGGGGGGDAESQPTPVVAVQTAIVQARPFTETFGTIGTVVGRPGHVASLGAPTATRVSRVYVSEGARVAAGQPLVELDRTAIDAAAQAAETALTSAQQAYERADRLNREGVSPRKDVEQAAAEAGFAFSGVDKPSTADGLYGLRYEDFVVPLVKAVQEQQQQIEALQRGNIDMQRRVKQVEQKVKH